MGIPRRALAVPLILACLGSSPAEADITSCVLEKYPKIAASTDPILWVGDETDLTAFGFRKTIDRILVSAGAEASDANAAALVDSLFRSFGAPEFVNPLSGVAQPLRPRKEEAKLTAAQLFDEDFGLKPAALLNRLDLMPAGGEHCGEYRIVYDMTRLRNRHVELIFEAALPNPTPGDAAGCAAVARFWRGLERLGPEERVRALEEFYYRGTILDGLKVAPVVTWTHYGSPYGQVRSNTFFDSPWTLREWRIVQAADGTPSFLSDTVKATPLPGYYGEATGTEPFDKHRRLFQALLRGSSGTDALVRALWAPELGTIPQVNEDLRLAEALRKAGQAGMPNAVILQSFGLPTGELFNGGESDDEPADDPGKMASQELRLAIEEVLNPVLQGNNLIDGTLARASLLTCVGCHHETNDRALGKDQGTLVWPQLRFFRHVGDGSPSRAMVEVFFPFRALQVAKALCGGIRITSAKDVGSALLVTPEQAALLGLDSSDTSFENLRAIDQVTPGALSYFRRPH